MAFGNCSSNTESVKKDTQAPAESESNYKNLIAMLIRLVKEQKLMIEQQQSDIAEMKVMIKEIKRIADLLLRVEAYEANS